MRPEDTKGHPVYNPAVDHERLVTLFRNWSDVEAVANLSPLYQLLGNAVADDAGLLELAGEALPGQPPPNVLFAAVHALLADRAGHPLAAYYSTLGGSRAAAPEAVGLFREFCLEHRDELLPAIRTRLVQTNEVRRSAILLPAFASAAEDAGQPLALFEIGPSAGLNLLFDRYRYRFGDVEIGPAGSPVVLESEPRGAVPALPIPAVASRLGVDINPLDVTNPEDVAWLRALLWPEHTDRLALLDAALKVARQSPPELLRGDIFGLLPPRVAATPKGHAVCLFATFVLNQFSPAMLSRLRGMLVSLADVRPVYLVVMGFTEFIEPGTPWIGDAQVWVLRLRDGAADYRLSSTANPHGRWIDWVPESPWKRWEPKY